ncbi:MAG: hypothetical protein K1W24_00570 [Lachnospiraceae bacterium]
MDNKYETVYKQFEKNFKEEAGAFIAGEDIKSTLKMEKTRFNNAEKYNIPINKFAGSSLARYTKDMLRQHQPLFFIYYMSGIVTEFFYCLLIWGIIKCTFLYIAGNGQKVFSEKINISISVVFFAVVIICSYITRFYTRKLLYSCKGNIKRKIFIFNSACYTASAIIIIIHTLYIYLNNKNYLEASLSLFQIFIITVAVLSASGIHNVIYSSHFNSFISIGIAIIRRRPAEKNKAAEKYLALTLESFLIQHNMSMAAYKENSQLQSDFKKWVRSKAVTLRTYGAIAFFILVILVITCLRQLVITGFSAGFIIFSITTLVITVILFLEILSCNQVIKSSNTW